MRTWPGAGKSPGRAGVRAVFPTLWNWERAAKSARVIPLETADEKGKPKPREMELPAPVKRTVGVASNFLWDNGSYLLGHAKDAAKDSRAEKCFAAAKELHLSLLSGSQDPFAQAICRFFENYDPALGSTDRFWPGNGRI